LTSSLVSGRNVDVEQKDVDRYGRIVGLVKIDGQGLNELIIQNGYAWVYQQYCKESFCSEWNQSEAAACKQKKKGSGWTLLRLHSGIGDIIKTIHSGPA